MHDPPPLQPWHITNSGERADDRQFELPPGSDDEPFHIIHQLRISSRFHKTQMAHWTHDGPLSFG